MAFKVKMQVTNLEPLLAQLKEFDEKVQKRGVRKAVADASLIVSDAAMQKAPRRTGQLAKSIGVKVKRYGRTGVVVAIVGPRKGFRTFEYGRPNDPVKYAHLVELGTSHSAAQPFLRPALENNKARIEAVMAEVIKKVMLRAARKIAKAALKARGA